MAHPTIRGRGAAHNPPNRFEPIEVELDARVEAEDPGPETRFFRDASRSIVATNDSPDVGFDASVNPYRGCEHGCVYCADGETPILLCDGKTRVLAEVRPGDRVYGTRRAGRYRRYAESLILDHWETRRPAYAVTLQEDTRLVVGADHRFLTLRGWKFVTGTEQGADRRPHLTTNDVLLGVGRLARTRPSSTEYRHGYLCGMIRGDGHLAIHDHTRSTGSRGRLYQFRLALIDREALDRTAHYLRLSAVETRPSRFSPAREGRREIRAIRTASRESFERITELVRWPGLPSDEWCRGFLAGTFDAEGSFSGGSLRVSNTDWSVIEEFVASAGRFGFRVDVTSQAKNRAKPISSVSIAGGLSESLRFFHTTDPAIARKRKIAGRALKGGPALRVVSIEPLGVRTLFDITTTTGDYISDGTVSHNCYARPTHEYFGLSAGIDFETRIFVKRDAPKLLRRKLESPRWEPRVLAMSGVTDPYQPVERRLGVTRGCLEVLAEFRNPVAIVTKSGLVTRDADLLAELAGHRAAVVSLSITTLRNEVQRVMEPRAATPTRRLEAIRRLTDAGVPCGVMVGPVIPGLTDHEMPAILEAAANAGAVRAGWIMLRLPHGVKELFAEWLERHFPERRGKVLNRLRSLRGGRLNDPRFGARMRGAGPFADQVRAMFDVACRQAGLNRVPLELSTAAFRRPASGSQLPLFEAGT